jgi:methylglutaconyl-CoA hydratase
MENYLIIEVENRVGTITLNRPEKRNALDETMVNSLKDVFLSLDKNPDVKVIVLKSSGKVFCSGADLAYLQKLQEFTFEQNLADSNNLRSLFELIRSLSKVVIACVKGPTIAGGCGLLSVCDVVFATHESHFTYTEVKIGFVPAIVMVYLVKRIGEGRARELLLSARTFQAQEAHQIGYVHFLHPQEEIDNEVEKYARFLISNNSSNSMAVTKQLFQQGLDMPVEKTLDMAVALNAKTRGSDDCKKGIAAFISKEALSW